MGGDKKKKSRDLSIQFHFNPIYMLFGQSLMMMGDHGFFTVDMLPKKRALPRNSVVKSTHSCAALGSGHGAGVVE